MENKNRIINLNGSTSTMRLGLVIYVAAVLCFTVCAGICYAAGDPDCQQPVQLHFQPYQSHWTDSAWTWHYAGRSVAEIARSEPESKWVSDLGRWNHHHIHKRDSEYDCWITTCSVI